MTLRPPYRQLSPLLQGPGRSVSAPDLPSWEGQGWDPVAVRLGWGLGWPTDVPVLSWKGKEEPARQSFERSVGLLSSTATSCRLWSLRHEAVPPCSRPLLCPASQPRCLQGLPHPPALQPQAMGPRSEPGRGFPGRRGETPRVKTGSYPYPCLLLCFRDPSYPSRTHKGCCLDCLRPEPSPAWTCWKFAGLDRLRVWF